MCQSDSSTDCTEVFVFNSYNLKDGFSGLDYTSALGSFAGRIAEPHRASTLRLIGSGTGETRYSWKVDGEAVEDDVHHFRSLGEHTVEVEEVEESGLSGNVRRVLRRASAKVWVSHVKREFRSLEQQDWEAFLTAAQTIFTTQASEGRALYGAEFKDISYFLAKHNDLASDKACDHMHDGTGFLSNHISMQLEWDRVLALVDPSVTTPVWDYTVEMEAVESSGGDYSSYFWASPLFAFEAIGDGSRELVGDSITFSDNWGFGAVSLSAEFWADSLASSGSIGQSRNAFGHMRAPWNLNPVRTYTDRCVCCPALPSVLHAP